MKSPQYRCLKTTGDLETFPKAKLVSPGKGDVRNKLMNSAEYERANQRLPDSGEDLSSGSSVHFKPISAVGSLCKEKVDKESVASQYEDSEDLD